MIKDQIKEINKILKRPKIANIRKGTGPRVQWATYKTVADYVKNKK